ncbi:hypothetical protein GCM10009846_30630 [Agrococcus versicolor]|uniref:Uncharacterized protein n=1 Tax=Agrococcus versicolor TaxID=501482 RepID=A0ABP5MR12_9MICO
MTTKALATSSASTGPGRGGVAARPWDGSTVGMDAVVELVMVILVVALRLVCLGCGRRRRLPPAPSHVDPRVVPTWQ